MNWFGRSLPAPPAFPARPLVIGLVNNVPDRGREVTERQFRGLLQAACPGGTTHLRLFTCAGPTDAGDPYASADDIFDDELDGLIVTGMEPRARALRDEPAWGTLSRLADWAEDRAVPVIWSCLAAHVATLYLDGIARERVEPKISGVFDCDLVSLHPLASGLPRRWGSPHSRHNGVPEKLLAAKGYEILSRSEQVGADVFLKQEAAPFLFFQGHPEYDADALAHEYKRDLRRYLAGERSEYPEMPANYFDEETQCRLSRIRREVEDGDRDPLLLREVCALVNDLAYACPWRSPATCLVANWLGFAARRAARNAALARLAIASGELRP